MVSFPTSVESFPTNVVAVRATVVGFLTSVVGFPTSVVPKRTAVVRFPTTVVGFPTKNRDSLPACSHDKKNCPRDSRPIDRADNGPKPAERGRTNYHADEEHRISNTPQQDRF